MHKELIKKYKAEFNHWLNDGKLQAKFNGNSWIEAPKDIFAFNYVANFILVIDDEFVEFRKALAEGKTVQYNFGNFGTNKKDFPNTWKDLDLSVGILADRACPENYRTKPEEPKFKIGDWVRDLRDNRVFQINSVNFNLNLSITNGVYIHWEPKPGELVIFKDKNSIISIIKYNGETNVYPFIGEITWLHKKD